MHWMKDWATPHPIYVKSAKGALLRDVDGLVYDDFCLGDTPSMFGHSRSELQSALTKQAGEGMGFMLPSETSNEVGELLAKRLSLPYWQVTTTASDANRSVIRWARAITKRPKILVFDGCYHGMIDECTLSLQEGSLQDGQDGQALRARPKPGLIGQVTDVSLTTTVIPFNDLKALRAALKAKDVAAVLAEPVMTNCGMIAPLDGFLAALRAETKKTGTLLIYDETHTLSSGPAGYCGLHGLESDMLTIGKAIAGGIPAAVWGVSEAVAERMEAVEVDVGYGSSGMGTTLSGNALVMTALKTMLMEVITPANYALMLSGAQRLEAGLKAVIARHDLPWCVVSAGARLELVFAPTPPQNAVDMRKTMDMDITKALHLSLINQGVLIAPFHTMMLVSPKTDTAQIDRLILAVDNFAFSLKAHNL
jgi:glutamate-1-semialdehyde 2,1-aminomutase